MKRNFFFKGLCILFLIGSLSFGSSGVLHAQEITAYQYRHVPPEKLDEFIKRETTYWSKIAKKAIDEGKMSFWALLEKVGGEDMGNSSNVLFVNTFPDIDADLSKVFDPRTLFPGVSVGDMDTYSMSTVTSEIFIRNDGWQQVEGANPENDFKYVVMNYHNASDPSRFVATEDNNWAPFIKDAMDKGLTDQKAWGNSVVLAPTGGPMKFNCLSVDLFSNLKAALSQQWKPETKFPTVGLDSLQKLSLNPPARFIYRVVMVESKN